MSRVQFPVRLLFGLTTVIALAASATVNDEHYRNGVLIMLLSVNFVYAGYRLFRRWLSPNNGE